jgi:dihydroxyacetone kinase-like predicted kinase
MTAREWRERWERAERTLERHAGTVDRLNVFPVADRDTGHNMLATLHAGVSGLAEAPERPQASARALVDGAVRMARGNSGVILSQWLRGFLEAAPQSGEWTLDHFRAALGAGARFAREHVAEPVDGTILTVADAAAAGASQPAAGDEHFWASVLESAAGALSSTWSSKASPAPPQAHQR